MNKKIDILELKNINKPARYVGGEVNQIIKSNFKSSIVLCYPNVYEKAMSNYAIRLLYTNINRIDGIYCKRCFAPEMDFEQLLYNKDCDLYSLEDKESIRKSDYLLFVIDSELDYTNFLNMLALAKIKFDKKDRKRTDPKVLILPLGTINIKPVEKFADIIFNDGNDENKMKKAVRFLKRTTVDGDVNMDNEEIIELNYPTDSIVPSIKVQNSNLIIDLALVNNIDDVINSIKESVQLQGIKGVSFINQDKIDNFKFCEIIYRIKVNIDDVKISARNFNFARFKLNEIDTILPCIGKCALKFNVITCSNTLIEKTGIGIQKEKLLENIKHVFKNNWSSVKLEFNIGLPKETYEDIDDIFNTAEEIVNIYAQSKAKDKLSLIVKINCYIPNLNECSTSSINSINKLETKIRYIAEKKYDPVIKLSLESADMYIAKVLLRNGEEDITDILVSAYELGARFDKNVSMESKNAWDKAIFDNIGVVNKYIKNSI